MWVIPSILGPIVVLMIWAAMVPKMVSRPLAGKLAAAKSDLGMIAGSLNQFKVDMGRYPTASEGIGALVHPPIGNQHGPYLPREPRDPWNDPYVYKVLATGGFKISSAGRIRLRTRLMTSR
jgi:general secretion pathway protein G